MKGEIFTKPYPTDVSDEERAFVVPYLILLPEDAGQRSYSLRQLYLITYHLTTTNRCISAPLFA